VLSLDRRKVRRRFEQRFTATRMAKDYLQVYHSLFRRELPVDQAAALNRLAVLENEMN
jgi:hypothetical protein